MNHLSYDHNHESVNGKENVNDGPGPGHVRFLDVGAAVNAHAPARNAHEGAEET